MNKHTPGPWKVHRHKDGYYSVVTEKHDGNSLSREVVAEAYHPDGSPKNSRGPEAEANAKLCAAAPALLDALKSVHMALQTGKPSNYEERIGLMHFILDTIAKVD